MTELIGIAAFSRLILNDRAIRFSPNVIDARPVFNQRADDVRSTRIQRNKND